MTQSEETSARSDRGRPWRIAGKVLFSALFLVAGVSHFTRTDFLLKAMPPDLPYPRELVLISGAFEIALGVLLLVPKTSRLAGWGLIALLIAVFPANIYMYKHAELFPYPTMGLLLRLPVQGLLILWAYAYTRGGRPTPSASEGDQPG